MKPTEKTELLVTEDGEDTSYWGRRYVYLTFLSPAFCGLPLWLQHRRCQRLDHKPARATR